MKFSDRFGAGEKLATKLKAYQDKKDTLILAIPRGGVLVASELAKRLKLPMDLLIIRKLGHPVSSELALGAVSSGGAYWNKEILQLVGIEEDSLKIQIENLKKEIKKREKIFRHGVKPPNLENKSIILTDDGIATGSTMAAAILTIKKQKPKEIIVAVPVASQEALKKIAKIADRTIVIMTPEHFNAVGEFYENFSQISDGEVISLLEKNN